MLRSFRKIHQFFVDKSINNGVILHQRYRVVDLLGAGSYGMVYRCNDIHSKECKVVKQLRPSKRKNKKEIQLFNHEKAIIQKLDHSRMPIFYEAFSEDRNYYYVMSLIQGKNLEEAIFSHQKTFDENESLRFVSKLLELVDYLHMNDIFHLDLRIPNIIIKNDEPHLIDFGLAKVPNASTNKENAEELRLQDYYDIGDVLLYLLYTTYTTKKNKALPWTEELSLQNETVYLLKRLLRIDTPYSTIKEISSDFQAAIKANGLVE
ncbi:protein kinase [Paucisalibacillus sp. EB02]|uniref:serine/threonine protein kinase n=1 Tax=Paucisalibacillus sp. EB02 TaxID=1347087 RepID=UPI0004AE3342|nr:protein kinase [Paucisalibacillus sp. EB02]